MDFPKYITVRLVILTLLSVLCFALSYNKIFTKTIVLPPKPNADSLLAVLDAKIDTVLFQSGVQEYWIKKQDSEIPGSRKKRRTRNVFLPSATPPTLLNKQLQGLALKFNCEATATQDLRKFVLTMQMKYEGVIVERVVLTSTNNLPPAPKPKVVKEKKNGTVAKVAKKQPGKKVGKNGKRRK